MSELSVAARELIAALREESGLCAALLTLTAREERAIIDSNVADLTTLTEEKEGLLELLATLETERMTALIAIGLAAGQDTSAFTLSKVVTLVPAAERVQLVAVQAELRGSSTALEEATRHNAELLRASRELIDRWVQYLRNMITGSLTYTPGGASQGTRQPRVFDRSA